MALERLTDQLAALVELVVVVMAGLITPQETRKVVLDQQILVVAAERKALVRKQIHQQHLALVVLAL